MCKGEGAGGCVFRSVLFLFFAGGERLRGGGGGERDCVYVCGGVRVRVCACVNASRFTGR